jgi:hypothetical protein
MHTFIFNEATVVFARVQVETHANFQVISSCLDHLHPPVLAA